MRAWRIGVATIAMLAAPCVARADGEPCATSDECGGLKCIEGQCTDLNEAISRGPSHTVGDKAMFGTRSGYGKYIAMADIIATVSEPFLMIGAVSNYAPTSTIFGVMCFVPVALAGSIVHAVHARAAPALISFFAWTSLAGTTFVVGGLTGLAFGQGGRFDSVAAWVAGLSFGAAGAGLLTWLDVWMARDVTSRAKPPAALVFSPGIVPTRGGAIASLGARF